MINPAGIALGHDLAVLDDDHGAGARAIAIGTLVEREGDRDIEALGLFGPQADLNVGADGAAPVFPRHVRPGGKARQVADHGLIGAGRQLGTAKAGPVGSNARRHGRVVEHAHGLLAEVDAGFRQLVIGPAVVRVDAVQIIVF